MQANYTHDDVMIQLYSEKQTIFFCSCCSHVLTCEEEEHEDHDHGITKVEDGAGHSDDLQL